jgi:hypothetical protein
MPGYGGDGSAQLLRQNNQALLFAKEELHAGTKSVAYQLERSPGGYPWGMSLQLSFDSAPGAFQINIEIADSDTDSSYIGVSSIDDSSPRAAALTNFWAKFVRAHCTAMTGTAKATLMLTL